MKRRGDDTIAMAISSERKCIDFIDSRGVECDILESRDGVHVFGRGRAKVPVKDVEVATATENPTIPVRIRQNHLINSPNGAMNGDA